MTCHPLHNVETPCIGICSTIYGDEICRGCFRHYQEVIDWNTYSDTKKLTVLNHLNTRMLQVFIDKFEVTDENLLKTKCTEFNIKIRPSWDPLTWAHALLREGLHQIRNPLNFGIRILPQYTHLRLPQLVQLIDDEIYHVSLTYQTVLQS